MFGGLGKKFIKGENLRADDLNRLMIELNKLSKISVSAPLTLHQSSLGTHIGFAGGNGTVIFDAKLTQTLDRGTKSDPTSSYVNLYSGNGEDGLTLQDTEIKVYDAGKLSRRLPADTEIQVMLRDGQYWFHGDVPMHDVVAISEELTAEADAPVTCVFPDTEEEITAYLQYEATGILSGSILLVEWRPVVQQWWIVGAPCQSGEDT